MTMTLPLRLMILHFSQIGFTDGRTFMSVPSLSHGGEKRRLSVATMLATARGADLDNLAALFGVQRLVITQATEDAEAIYESDDDLRARTQLAPEAYTTAGSIGAYEFHARTADARVRDVSVTSPEPGTVLVTVLGDDVSSGTPEDLLLAVQTALNEEQVRPLCDAVAVSAPELVEYQVDAVLTVGSGPDANVVLAAAQAAVAIYIADVQRLGATVARSGLLAALHRPGVIRVALSSPVADIECGATQAPVSTAVSVVLEGQA